MDEQLDCYYPQSSREAEFSHFQSALEEEGL